VKIGIYTAFGPNTFLGKEGLGRYIGSLVQDFTQAGHEITLACPKWSQCDIEELLREFQVDIGRVHFLVSRKTPVLQNIWSRRKHKRKPSGRIIKNLLSSTEKMITNLAIRISAITSVFKFSVVLMILLVIGIVLLPIVLLLGGGVLILSLAVWVSLILKKFAYKAVAVMKDTFVARLGSQKRAVALETKKILSIRERVYIEVSTQIQRKTGQELVALINHSEVQDVWFVPTLFWPESLKIRGTKVICAPDLVTALYPAQFAKNPGNIVMTRRCRETLEQGEFFIAYCKYLKDSLLYGEYGKVKTKVIPHRINNMSSYIAIDTSEEVRLNAQKNFTTAFARSRFETVRLKSILIDPTYTSGFSMENVRYIFYASQHRPNKNLKNLILAYEELLRKRYCGVKLIITANLSEVDSAELYNYLCTQRLQYDVLCFPNLTMQELAAVYHCAELVVTPTLYEGGFPFTFGEGMSVGTPSVMSDIPQVREVVERFGLEEAMLFDPYDWKAMADKIEYALQNRDALYQKELPMYRELEKRTGSVVAEEYVHAFEYFIEQDKLAQNN